VNAKIITAYFIAALCAVAAPALLRADSAAEKYGAADKYSAAEKESRASLAFLQPADAAEERDVAALFHQINIHEIAMAKLAQQRAYAPGIKNYAEMIVNDHIAADNKLLEICRRRGLDLAASSVRPDDEDSMMSLETLKGEKFDSEFLRIMHIGHANAIAEFSAAQTSLPVGELRSFLAEQLPMLTAHENTAVQLQKAERQVHNPAGE